MGGKFVINQICKSFFAICKVNKGLLDQRLETINHYTNSGIGSRYLSFDKVANSFSNTVESFLRPEMNRDSFNINPEGDFGWEGAGGSWFPSLQNYHPFREMVGLIVENLEEILFVRELELEASLSKVSSNRARGSFPSVGEERNHRPHPLNFRVGESSNNCKRMFLTEFRVVESRDSNARDTRREVGGSNSFPFFSVRSLARHS